MEEAVPRTPLSRRDTNVFAFAPPAHDKAPVSPLLTMLRTPSVRNSGAAAGDGAPGNAKRTPTRGKVRRTLACAHSPTAT
jgi:hypothetical protein